VWLSQHPLERGGKSEHMVQDPFDYAAEDRLIAAWKQALATIPKDLFRRKPGYTVAYSGPGGSQRKSDW